LAVPEILLLLLLLLLLLCLARVAGRNRHSSRRRREAPARGLRTGLRTGCGWRRGRGKRSTGTTTTSSSSSSSSSGTGRGGCGRSWHVLGQRHSDESRQVPAPLLSIHHWRRRTSCPCLRGGWHRGLGSGGCGCGASGWRHTVPRCTWRGMRRRCTKQTSTAPGG